MENYKYTGKNIPLQLDTGINYVIEKLKAYDNALATNPDLITRSDSPYNHKIIMKTNEGKYIEIPTEVQREAIKKWMIMKSPQSNKELIDDTTDTDSEIEVEVKKKKKSKLDSMFNNTLFIILLFIIAIVCGLYYTYYFNCVSQNFL